MKKFLLPIAKFLEIKFGSQKQHHCWCGNCGRHYTDGGVETRYVAIRYGYSDRSTSVVVLCELCASEWALKIQTLLLNH